MASVWSSMLNGSSQSLDLPFDKVRASSADSSRNLLPLATHGVSWDKADGCCLLGAFQVFLHRITSQELITLGVQPQALLKLSAASYNGSGSPEALLPLACLPLHECGTLSSLAAELQGQLNQLVAHVGTPLQDILAAIGHSSSKDNTTHHPIFQAAIVVAQEDGVQTAAALADSLDLALLVAPGLQQEDPPRVHLLYNSSLFHKESASLMAEHLGVFLAAALSQPAAPLLQLPLMSVAEQLLVLQGFNQNDRHYDTAGLVHKRFAEHAATQPNAAAVVFEGMPYTYAEINARANRIANHLVSLGVRPGSIVGVLLLRSPNMVAALLGVLKAGAAYLPLDHHHPEERIALMLEDAGVQAVLVQPDLLPKLPAAHEQQRLGLATVQLTAHSLGDAAAAATGWSLGELAQPGSCCYIIYTSGSTGKPKGVAVKHAGLTAYIAWLHTHFGINPADVFIQKTPTNFDASVDELWAALAAGATLVVAPPEAHRDVHTVMDLITRHGVTTASFVPSQLHLLAREVLALYSTAQIQAGAAPCASLKRVLSGGEALTSAAAADITAALPHCQLWNTYGPTETTVGIASWLYDPATAGCSNTVPIGRGIHNSRLYVLDSALQPVPIGVPGQLFLSGHGVSAGYLNRPELNATTFVPNPFSCYEKPGSNTELMYRTGDLVRWLPGHPEGVLEFLGRVDHQVKLRGFRIELQEVEAAMAALPGVCQVATAIVRSPITQQDHLAAWVSPDSLEPQVLSGLTSKLPHYMIPTVVVPLAALPLLPSEKVNRKALPAPDWSKHMAAAAAPASAPASALPAAADTAAALLQDPLMQYLQGLWAEVLSQGVNDINPYSDFFAMGGNSLLVGVMNSRVRARLTAPGMSGLLLYQHPTLQDFAAAVRAAVEALPSGLCSDCGSSDSSYSEVVMIFAGGDAGSNTGKPAGHAGFAAGKGGKVAVSSITGSEQEALKQDAVAGAWLASATIAQLFGGAFGMSVEFLVGLVPLLVFEAMFTMWSWKALALQPAIEFVLLLIYLLVAWGAKWLLVGRYKEGVHGIYGRFYVCHWLANLLCMDARVYALPLMKRTVLLNYFYRAMGMNVSSGACLQTTEFNAYDLITIDDAACLEPHSAVAAITFTARQDEDKFPLGSMSLKAAHVGKGAILGPQTQVTSCVVPDGAFVEPCTASSNPVQKNSYANPTDGAAVRTMHKPLAAWPALLAVLCFCVLSSLLSMPAVVASIVIWDKLTQSTEDVYDTISSALRCWVQLPGVRDQLDIEVCSDLMVNELISMIPYIFFLYAMGQVAVFALIPIKWLLVGKMTPEKCRQQGGWWHFRVHLFEALMDHPFVRMGAFLWAGTEVYNIWLRGLGMKIGRQAWIGEDLHCSAPDLLEIGDCVSITSGCSIFPATDAAVKPVMLHPGCDVTNQTALYAGVEVKPGAVVGVFTYAAQDRVFPAGSITQGSMVLRPGHPDIHEDEVAELGLLGLHQQQSSSAAIACQGRLVSTTRYTIFNILYGLGIWVLVPVTDCMFLLPLYGVVLAAMYFGGLLLLVTVLPFAFIAAVSCLLIWLVLVKRVMIPRCQGSHPLYTYKPTAWMMYGIVLLLHEATLLRGLMGSQLGVWFYRALGAKIGKHTCILGPLYNQEPDCVTIGDYTVIDEGSFIMAHTVEERCLKFVDVKIGKGVTIGGNSCVMPGGCVEDGAFIGDVSLVMKGEVVPRGTCWSGVPAVPHAKDAPTMF